MIVILLLLFVEVIELDVNVCGNSRPFIPNPLFSASLFIEVLLPARLGDGIMNGVSLSREARINCEYQLDM